MDDSELSVEGFRKKVQAEEQRLRGLCSRWEPKAEDDGQVRCAIGKANILMSGRFRQFSSLIDDCDRNDGRTRVTDLQGFWEMIYFQVQDVEKLFQLLECPAASPTTTSSKTYKASKVPKVSGTPKKAVKSRGHSGLKAHILAMRKGLKTEPQIVVQQSENDRVFDGGFFKVKSPSPLVVAKSSARTGMAPPLTPSGYNSRSTSSQPNSGSQRSGSGVAKFLTRDLTPYAVIKASSAIRKSLSPGIRRSELDFDI